MSPEKRSAVMARIRGKNTGPERTVEAALAMFPVEWTTHVRELPGRPDFVCEAARVAIFVDGDFWHGWRFPVWRDKLSEHWEAKVGANRRRDQRNHRRLRRMGWKVIRLWEHQIKRDLPHCMRRVAEALGAIALSDLK